MSEPHSFIGTVKTCVPRLRRFAIALSGSREGGDQIVAEMLRLMIEDGYRPTHPDGACAALFSYLLDNWTLLETAQSGLNSELEVRGFPMVGRYVATLDLTERAAFFLVTLEGMTIRQASDICSVGHDVVSRVMTQAVGRCEQELLSA